MDMRADHNTNSMTNVYFNEQKYERKMEEWEKHQREEKNGVFNYMERPKVSDFFEYRPPWGNLRLFTDN